MSERKHAGLNSLGICTDVFTLQPRPALGFGRMFCNIQKIAFKTIHIARLPSREDSASKRDDRTTYDMAHRAAMHRPPAAPLSRAISRRSPPSKAHEKEQSNRRLRESQRCSSGGHRHTPDDCGFKQHGTRLPAQALFSFLSLLPLLRQVSLDTKQLKVRSLCYYKVLCLPINFYF